MHTNTHTHTHTHNHTHTHTHTQSHTHTHTHTHTHRNRLVHGLGSGGQPAQDPGVNGGLAAAGLAALRWRVAIAQLQLDKLDGVEHLIKVVSGVGCGGIEKRN